MDLTKYKNYKDFKEKTGKTGDEAIKTLFEELQNKMGSKGLV